MDKQSSTSSKSCLNKGSNAEPSMTGVFSQPVITPMVRRFSQKMETGASGQTVVEGLNLAIEEQQREEISAEAELRNWKTWLQFGTTTR